MSDEKRVAVTGIGMICALGTQREAVWEHMLVGHCGIGPVTLFDTDGYRSRVAAEVDLSDVQARFTPYQRRRWSRSDMMGVIAADEALEDSGLLDSGIDRTRVGVLLGAGTGDLVRNESYYFTMRREGIGHARPTWIHGHFSSTPVDVIAGHFGFEGVRSRLTFAGFNALRLMDPQPCRPFDTGRQGMNIGEGAAILVLEDWDRAARRGAHIYAELAGYSFTCEAYHPTAPEPEGRAIAATIRAALEDAQVDASEVTHVNAHGTATPQNDRAEARGVHVVFGERARTLPVTSLKAMFGHCLGAAGAMEAAALALTIDRGCIPPTINHDTTDPDCAIDLVANVPREVAVSCAVSTSLAFGGNDSALVLRHV